jgi:NTP pyrophosphatase (non-canonical NTP hydrolase)
MADLNAKKAGNLDLDDFVKEIQNIYDNQDQKRSIWDVWLHANHHASAIGEEVRKNKPGGTLLVEIADFAMWLFTFLVKLQGTTGKAKAADHREEESLIRVTMGFSDLLWHKYPGMCPVCYWRRTDGGNRKKEKNKHFGDSCDCLLFDIESRDQSDKKPHTKALRAYAREIIKCKPVSVDDWQEMFARIYKANLRHIDLRDTAFHLLEEMGEVSDAIVRIYTYSTSVPPPPKELPWRQMWLEGEIADVSSWLLALVEKLDFIRETADEYDKWRYKGERPFAARTKIQLSRIIWTRYGSDERKCFYCPHCKETTCTCEVRLIGRADLS